MAKTLLLATVALFMGGAALAQVAVDVEYERVAKAVGTTLISDLSINDTAIIYSAFCIENGQLYIPGWVQPYDLANATYAQTGILIRATVLPGRRLRAVYIDGAQAQAIAKGNPSAPAVLSKDDFANAVRIAIERLFRGGTFGVQTCEQEREESPLLEMELYTVESLNGFHSLSELLKSVGG